MTESLDIIFQDEHLVAINKPSGLLVHRSEIDRRETRFAVQLLRDQIGRQVYPAHRLDKPTSGVLLFALSSQVARNLGEQFSTQKISKHYLAIVRGCCAAEGIIDHPLREDPDPYAGRVEPGPPQPALTRYRQLATIELPFAIDKYPTSRYALVLCQPQTGRKHQIRRHMKHISHPIIGDAKHGKGLHNRKFQEVYGVGRLLLAATQMDFVHPVTQQPLRLVAPPRDGFRQLLDTFNWTQELPCAWQ